MTMNLLQLHEAETRAILARWRTLGRPVKPKRKHTAAPEPTARALREAAILQESAKLEDRVALHHRIIFGTPVTLPVGTHEKLAKLLTGRREPPPPPPPAADDLHERLRRAVTR